jgi:ferredoxin, 2Fe-2S
VNEVFQVTFHFEETGETRVVRVNPGRSSTFRVGLAGSILDIAAGARIDIEHPCGGVCACPFCHVKVVEGRLSCSQPTEDEDDMLTTSRGRDADSRLACQCVPDGTRDLAVVIPGWHSGGTGGSAVPTSGNDPRPPSVTGHAAEPAGAPDAAAESDCVDNFTARRGR